MPFNELVPLVEHTTHLPYPFGGCTLTGLLTFDDLLEHRYVLIAKHEEQLLKYLVHKG